MKSLHSICAVLCCHFVWRSFFFLERETRLIFPLVILKKMVTIFCLCKKTIFISPLICVKFTLNKVFFSLFVSFLNAMKKSVLLQYSVYYNIYFWEFVYPFFVILYSTAYLWSVKCWMTIHTKGSDKSYVTCVCATTSCSPVCWDPWESPRSFHSAIFLW